MITNKEKKITFAIPVFIRPRKHGQRSYNATMFIEDWSREDARWQLHHGVIEAEITRMHGEQARVQYDCRKLRQHSAK